ncbi:hypothetical protein [Priestia taiwanensis]|uniref:Uncharacterized protein n=1 Tax=Priestia taiwanensis TaxID=1347902 RepID=A0A917EQ56_9BACI|nr:hypothetical protein [Priestia taiwanensis]MBM7364104.1 hypothetical protein [Priestia taiwanensis]GGE71623.1 hypothetical protein GCM10007140_21970 [Priestia taiwanensis]
MARKHVGYVPKLSLVSMTSTMVFYKQERELFLRLCSKLIARLVEKEEMKEYRFFLLCVAERGHESPRFFNYYKLWKGLGRRVDLRNFHLGPEVEYIEDGELRYVSIAECTVSDVHSAMKLMLSNCSSFVIFFSKRKDCMTEAFIRSLVEKVYIDGEINCFKLALTRCLEGDLVFRWGDSSEECELAIIMLEEYKQIFNSVSFHDE